MSSMVRASLTISLFLVTVYSYSLKVYAQTEPPQFVTVDGRLYDSATPTNPLLDSSVAMTIQVLNPAKTCILYEEQQAVNTLAANGYFNVRVGSPTSGADSLKRSANDSGNSMMTVFQNQNSLITGKTSAGLGCSYTPSSGDARYFRFVVTPSTTGVTTQLSPDMTIDSVPQALVAESLQGLGTSDFVQISANVTQAKLESLLGASYASLTGLLAGTSSLYLQNTVNGTLIPSRPSDPASPASGQIWYDSTANALKYYDGTTIQTLGTVGGGDPTKLPLAGGTMTGAIAMGSNDITAAGHITQSAQRTLRFGGYTGGQEATLTAGLLAGQEGTTWYNTTTDKLMYWNGTASEEVLTTASANSLVPNCTATQSLQMSAGPVYVWSCVATTDSTKLPLAGGTMTGSINMGSNDITSSGHITMSAQRTLRLGRYTTVQQGTLVGALIAGQEGTTWYNSDTNKYMYWDGTPGVAREIVDSTQLTGFGDITDVVAGAGLTGGAASGSATLDIGAGAGISVAADSISVNITGTTAETVPAAGDEILIYDASATALRKMTRGDFLTGYLTSESDTLATVTGRGASTATTVTMSTEAAVRFEDAAGGQYVALKSPATVATSYTLTLPDNDGNNLEVLQTDGNGVLSWVAIPSAPVASVFGRTGAVVSANGDYTASQVTNVAAGSVAATTVQTAIDELDTEKVPTTRTITTTANTSGLSGGGDLSANRSLSVDITGTTAETVVAGADEILIWDASATALRKMTRTNFVLSEAEVDAMVSNNGYLTAEADTLATVTGRGASTSTNITLDARAEVRLADTAGGEYAALKAPVTIGANYTLVLPDTDGDANQVLQTDGAGVLSWISIPSAPVASVHGRTGAVVSANGDYTASQVTNVAAGNITGTTVQAAIDELDTEKVAKAGDAMTGALTMNAQNQIRYADSAGGEYAAIQAPATIATNYVLTLPDTAGTNGQVLTTNGSGVLSWTTPTTGDITDVVAGAGLTGGATSGSATLDIGAGAGISVAADAISVNITGTTAETVPAAGDEILIYDASATALRKMTRGDFLTGYLTSESDTLATVTGRGANTSANITMDARAEVRLADAAGGEYAALKAPATIGANYTLVLPDTDGDANQVLQTDGAGVLSWVAIPSAPVTTVHGRTGAVVSANGDYTASQVTNVAAGSVAATTVQAAIDELDTEKVPTTRTIATTANTSGLSGGGDLSANRSLSVDITGTTAETGVAGADEILIWDASATALRKMTRTNFVLSEAEVDAMVSNNGYLTAEADTLATVTGRGASTATTVTMSTEAAVRFEDAAGGQYVALKSPATVATSYTLTLPDNDGNNLDVLQTDGNGVLSWVAIPSAPVASVFGRTGAVVSANGDYTASQVTNVAAGNIAATTVQTAIDELDTEKVAKAGDAMTGALTMNAQNQIRYADSAGGEYAAIQAPATIATNYVLTLPVDDGASGQFLQTDGSGVLSWAGAPAPAADSLDFTHFADAMTLDASTDIAVTGTNVLSVTNSGTGNSFVVNDQSGDTTPFVIDPSGNVGIGSATPSNKLDISNLNGGTIDEPVSVNQMAASPAAGVGTSIALKAGSGIVRIGKVAAAYEDGSGDYSYMSFFTRNTTFSEKIRITSAGNLGIGTTTPGTLLDVAGAITSRPYGTGAGNTGQIIMRELAANGTDTVTIRSPDANAASYVLTLPVDDGTSGQILSTDGSGVLSWVSSVAPAADSLDFTHFSDTMTLDANTDISATGSNVLSITNAGTGNSFVVNDQSGDTSPFVIDASGNVGIGTTAPIAGSMLNVVGDIYATGTTPEVFVYYDSANYVRILNNGSNSYFDYHGGDLYLRDDGVNTFRIKSGQVAIGNFNPSGQLDVGGSIMSRPYGTAAGEAGQIIMRELAANGTNTVTIRSPDANAADYVLTLPVDDGTNGQFLQTDGSGVLTWATPTATVADDSLDFDKFADSMNLDASTTITADGAEVLTLTNTGTGDSFVVNDQSSDTTPFVIDASGKVGIGTTAPQDTLHVIGSADGTGGGHVIVKNTSSGVNAFGGIEAQSDAVGTSLQLGYTSTGWNGGGNGWTGIPAGAAFLAGNSSNVSLAATNAASYINFMTGGGATTNERMRITSAGNVGIGTNAPSKLLDVYGGDANIYGLTVGRGAGAVSSNAALGLQALNANTTGSANTAVGYRTLYSLNTAGSSNTAIGFSALYTNTGGSNTAVGYAALYTNGSSDYNTAIGTEALNLSTGARNIGLGYRAGYQITTGANNVVIGSNGGSSIATLNNYILLSDGSGIERLRVNNSGNVGIGTTTIGARLDVEGRINSGPKGAAAGDGGSIIFEELDASAGTDYVGFRAPDDVTGTVVWELPAADGSSGQVLQTNGAGVLSWASGASSIGADTLDFDKFADSMALDASTTITADGAEVLIITNTGTGDSFVVNDQAGDTSPFVIDTSGNVGIGTTVPSVTLDVRGDGRFKTTSGGSPNLIILESPTSSAGDGPVISFQNTAPARQAEIAAEYEGSANNTGLAFITRSSGAGLTEKMRIDSAGNVGIGTTSASNQLHARTTDAGTNTTTNILRLEHESSGTPATSFGTGILFTGESTTTSNRDMAQMDAIWTTATDASRASAIRFSTLTGAGALSEKMRIDGNGYVGINNVAPSVALDVTGDIEYSGTLTDVSDRRLKENILPLDGALEKILAIEGVSFVMKNDKEKRVEIGVIAQDVEKVMPELVRTKDDAMKTKSVNYMGFIGYIIESIKELYRQLNKHNDDIEMLKKQNEELIKLVQKQQKQIEQIQKDSQRAPADSKSK